MARVVVKIRWQTEVVDTAPAFVSPDGLAGRSNPSTTHLLALMTMFTALLLAVSLRYSLGQFQQDLLRQSISALYSRGIENAEIQFNGLDATITGVSGSAAVSEIARRAVMAVPGVRSVRLRILETGPPQPQTADRDTSQMVEVAEALSALRTDLLQFAPGSASLSPGSSARLQRLAGSLRKHQAAAVEIEGHTDSSGDPASNGRLSELRAQAVRSTLLALGVSDRQLFATGYGASRPRATNDTAEGRAANRRIELRLRGAE